MFVWATTKMDYSNRDGSSGIVLSSELYTILQRFGIFMWCAHQHSTNFDSPSDTVSASLPFESGMSFASRINFVHGCWLDRRSRLNQCRQTDEGAFQLQLNNVITSQLEVNLQITDQVHHLQPQLISEHKSFAVLGAFQDCHRR